MRLLDKGLVCVIYKHVHVKEDMNLSTHIVNHVFCQRYMTIKVKKPTDYMEQAKLRQ